MICDARITEYKVVCKTSRVLLATIAVRVRVPVPLGFARVLLKRAIVAVVVRRCGYNRRINWREAVLV
ncbi:hypothetical protein PC128_g22600 [Phytophthora cactorum]|nr:hypothetical protein PC128_g22600 [Phytophthora cactorum]